MLNCHSLWKVWRIIDKKERALETDVSEAFL